MHNAAALGRGQGRQTTWKPRRLQGKQLRCIDLDSQPQEPWENKYPSLNPHTLWCFVMAIHELNLTGKIENNELSNLYGIRERGMMRCWAGLHSSLCSHSRFWEVWKHVDILQIESKVKAAWVTIEGTENQSRVQRTANTCCLSDGCHGHSAGGRTDPRNLQTACVCLYALSLGLQDKIGSQWKKILNLIRFIYLCNADMCKSDMGAVLDALYRTEQMNICVYIAESKACHYGRRELQITT